MRLLDEHFNTINSLLNGQLTRYPCEKLEISTVTEHYLIQDKRTHWVMEDYPCLTPPFERAWYEYKMPYQINMNGNVVNIVSALAGRRIGIYEVSRQIPEHMQSELTISDITPDLTNEIPSCKVDTTDPKYNVNLAEFIGKPVGWIVYRHLFLGPLHKHERVRYLVVHGDPVAFDGTAVHRTALLVSVDNPKANDITLQAFDSLYHPYFFAVSLMHCKNISTEISPGPRQERRQIKKLLRREPLVFKQLTIDTSVYRRAAKAAARKGVHETLQSRHLVRGHYKTYSDKGLFGKWKGRYWFQAHEAGVEDGKIQKEYVVK